ncbi:MAG: ABC transporter ATP-binding protein [Lachnospiraceae bacterium]|nr:ABC transporter ATP-binding protein [Lachnospiraceae bacterium]
MLSANGIMSGYGKVMILRDVGISVNDGEIVSIIGRNGVGKSTFMKTIIGLLKAQQGSILFEETDVTMQKSYDRAREGMGYVPQGHGVFPQLTVEENLTIGKMIKPDGSKKGNFDLVYRYFPKLEQRKKQLAGTMSGGEQAMLSIGRVLVGNPRILLLDEPSEGVQPNIVAEIGEIVKKISKELGIAVLMVEQHKGLIQQITERGYVMDKGSIIADLTRQEILDDEVMKKYLTV